MDEYWKTVGPTIPADHTDQYDSYRLVRESLAGRSQLEVLDLGCGDGRGVDFFRSIDSKVNYTGVDIESSPEVSSRKRGDAVFETFDGINLTYNDGRFDVVFSNQVFEHVANPLSLLKSVSRVFKPGGLFLGSVSQLEPYHSFSYWNFTTYGWCKLLEAANMKMLEFRPSIDCITLVHRSMNGRKDIHSKYFYSESPFNKKFDRQGKSNSLSIKQIVHRKVVYSGHLIFKASPNSSVLGPRLL